jgi:hypothetical protein
MNLRGWFSFFSVVVLACVYSSTVFAQGGGKAEPRRVEFKAGTNTTTINDRIKDSEEAEYVFVAKKGQRLTIKLTSTPGRSAVFDLKAPNEADLGLEYDANYNFNKVLPVTGEYFLVVVRPTSAKGRSSYKLVVTIR